MKLLKKKPTLSSTNSKQQPKSGPLQRLSSLRHKRSVSTSDIPPLSSSNGHPLPHQDQEKQDQKKELQHDTLQEKIIPQPNGNDKQDAESPAPTTITPSADRLSLRSVKSAKNSFLSDIAESDNEEFFDALETPPSDEDGEQKQENTSSSVNQATILSSSPPSKTSTSNNADQSSDNKSSNNSNNNNSTTTTTSVPAPATATVPTPATSSEMSKENSTHPSLAATSYTTSTKTTTKGGAAIDDQSSIKSNTPSHSQQHLLEEMSRNFRKEDVQMTEEQMEQDIKQITTALDLFLGTQLAEAEEICLQHAHDRLYYSIGYSLIQAIKSLMSFEPSDLESALAACKATLRMTNVLRKTAPSIYESATRWAKGASSIHSIKNMSRVERHAELVHAESLLLKSVVAILHSGDVFSFVREALSVRSAHAVYTNLAKYLESISTDSEEYDPHLASGILLGTGILSLILSLLPGRIIKLVQVFGYSGDRIEALNLLGKGASLPPPSPSSSSSSSPSSSPNNGDIRHGLRSPLADTILLAYHIVIASMLPVTEAEDMVYARKLLNHNLEKYPNGTFFLYYKGRLASTETRADDAQKSFYSAIEGQKDYRQLQHICYWELALSHISLGDYTSAYESFSVLTKESKWSRCVYNYSKGITLYESDQDEKEAQKILESVPEYMQRIAGKSMPVEKFCARKSKKFGVQNNRLMLPTLEFGYFINALAIAPRYSLQDVHLVKIQNCIDEMSKLLDDPSSWMEGESEFWDDWCLVHFLKAVVVRHIAFPNRKVQVNPAEANISQSDAYNICYECLDTVIQNANNLVHDHYLAWFAHYEFGLLYIAQKEYPKARDEFNIVLSGKIETKRKHGGGKVSMQNAALVLSNAALESIMSL